MQNEALRLIDLIFKSQRLDFDQWDCLVMVYIASKMVNKGEDAPVSRNKLADETRISSSKTDRIMNYLLDKQFVIRTVPHTTTEAARYLINEKELVI